MNTKIAILIVFTLAVAANGLPGKKKPDDKTGKDVKKEEAKKTEEKEDEGEEGGGGGGEEEEGEEVEDEEEDDLDEESKHMTFCLKEENVTEAEMKDFLMSKTVLVREPLKKAILCFLKKIEFFDGKNWNVENIAESIGENTKMFKNIKACLKKDDKKLQAHERTYRVQKCVLDSESGEKNKNK